jgi:hypothetical protein
MIRLQRLSVVLSLLPIVPLAGCGGDDSNADNADDLTNPETGDTNGEMTEAEGNEAEGDGDGDGDPTTGDGDGDPTGDGDGDGDPTGDGDGDGDGDPTGDGDGDGDPTGDGDGDPTGDGDGDPTGDGDGDPTGDGDGDPTGDGDGDGDPTTGDGDGDPDTGNDTNMACDEFSVTLEPITPNVMLVLDKSRSMFTNSWDHDANANTPVITRWNSLHQVVTNIVNGFETQLNFGSTLFPSTNAQNVYGPGACITADFPDVTVAPNNAAEILASIPAANVVNSYGGTPTWTGLNTAYQHLLDLPANIPRAMILVTDGAANCSQSAANNTALIENYDVAVPALVQEANQAGIPTYVVGVGIVNMIVNDGVGGDPNNINPTLKLNELAQLGGTGTFYNSVNQNQLLAALDLVVAEVQSCIIPLDGAPFFPEYTKVIVDGVEWDQVGNCANEDGWIYTDMNNDEIELCGDACDSLKNTGEADVEYYCNPG